LSHTRERRRAKRSGGKEYGEEAPRKSLSRLAATSRALALQREPARRLRQRLFASEEMKSLTSLTKIVTLVHTNMASNRNSLEAQNIQNC